MEALGYDNTVVSLERQVIFDIVMVNACFQGHFADYESNIGAKTGTPFAFNPSTTFCVSFLLLMKNTASAFCSRNTSKASATRSGLCCPGCLVFRMIAPGSLFRTRSQIFFPKVTAGSGADQTTRISVSGIRPMIDRHGPIPLPVDINTMLRKTLAMPSTPVLENPRM